MNDNEQRSKASTSAILRVLVAGYLIYIGVKIFQNENGEMSPLISKLIGGAFIAAALVFGIYIRKRWQADTANAALPETDSAIITEEADECETPAESSAALNALQALYKDYIEKALAAEKNRKPADGLFGFGKKAADDPCHEQFSESVETELKAFAETSPDSAEVRCVLEFMFQTPTAHQEPVSIYWMLEAVQGFAIPLIEKLSPQDAKRLKELYGSLYPRLQRLPIQNQVYDAL